MFLGRKGKQFNNKQKTMSNHSSMYAELTAKREAKLFARINRIVVIGFVVLAILYVAFEILRTL